MGHMAVNQAQAAAVLLNGYFCDLDVTPTFPLSVFLPPLSYREFVGIQIVNG
jgi:hypothetical protein